MPMSKDDEDLFLELGRDVQAAHAIWGVSNLDKSLEVLILLHMREMSREIEDKIFKGYGPLSTLAAKIDMAYALALIPKSLHTQLRLFNQIRNTFAHSAELLTFGSEEIAVLMEKLSGSAVKHSSSRIFLHYLGHCANELHAAKLDRMQTDPPSNQ